MNNFSSNNIYNLWAQISKTVNESKTTDEVIFSLIDLEFTKIYLSNNLNNQKKLYIKLSNTINERFSRPSLDGLKFDYLKNEAIEANAFYLVISWANSLVLNEAFDGFSAALLMSIVNCKLEADIPQTINNVCNSFADFFSGKRESKISDSVEVGLIGELFVLDELISRLGDDSVSTWLGPEGNKHDFSLFSNISLEVKTSTNNKKESVKISNEFQLNNYNLSSLYLRVIFIEKVNSGFNLNELVQKIIQKIPDPLNLSLFKAKLYQSKFDYLHDIRTRRFNVVSDDLYLVDDEFPKLTFTNIPNSISEVTYRLSLKNIEPVDEEVKQKIYVI